MNSLSDQQLLRDYAERRSDAAFAELVRRHVDLVYSAALRMVRDAHLAEDVAQGAFVALAQNAPQLMERAVLSGWLHRTAQNLAAKAIRSDVRRRAREQEAAAMNQLLSAESDAVWEHIVPHLDAALGELSDPDRDALLLRFFERKSAREMAQVLGVSDEAAQKRVTRAVERLREFFARRGVTVGASGLVALISANAVQAAPSGLGITISTATALAGTTVTTTATATTAKAIVMTALQKTVIATAVVAAVSTGVYEARQASRLRDRVQTLQQQQAPLAGEIEQLTRDRDDMRAKVAALREENDRLNSNTAELLKLRGEVSRLRASEQQLLQLKKSATEADDPFIQSVLALTVRAAQLNQYLAQMPDKSIPEIALLRESDWLEVAREASFQSEVEIRQSLSKLRSRAKSRFGQLAAHALDEYIRANNGQLPAETSQLKPFFEAPVEDAVLQRYRMLRSGDVNDLPKDTVYVISEKAPVDRDCDSHMYVGPKGRSGSWGTGMGAKGDPDETWATR